MAHNLKLITEHLDQSITAVNLKLLKRPVSQML